MESVISYCTLEMRGIFCLPLISPLTHGIYYHGLSRWKGSDTSEDFNRRRYMTLLLLAGRNDFYAKYN